MGKYAITKKKLYEVVLDQITELIENGEYGVGDKLPSLQELSGMFEVGKPTLREALSVLASAGVLEIRHGSGIYVLRTSKDKIPGVHLDRVDRDNLLNWLEFRRALEGETARLAAERCNAEDLRQIEEAQLYLEEEINQGRNGAEWDYLFHKRIALATHNPIFSQAITTTEDILKQYFELSIKQSLALPSRREVVKSEHRELIEYLQLQDSEGAKNAMLRHIDNVEMKVKLFSDFD